MEFLVQEETPVPAYSAEEGTWGRVYGQPTEGPKAAIFLDRDGVIVEEVGYLHRTEDVRIMDGATGLIAAANSHSVPVVVVTNQAGVGRGLYDWAAFEAVIDRMINLLEAEGAAVDAVYACPFHPQGLPPFAHPSHPSRKPNPGMFRRAAADLDLDLSSSWMIGDTIGDVEAARSANLAGAIHLLTGYGSRDRSAVLGLVGGGLDISLADDLVEARSLIPALSAGAHHSRIPAQ
jgi:D-glycero-D-manno-heptose 1,7-bisphosphate phosphatase